MEIKIATVGESGVEYLKTAKPLPVSIFVETREWYDSVNGNSYFSSRIYVDGRHVYTTGQTYGYDTQHEYDATKILVNRGYLPGEMYSKSIRWAKDFGAHVYTVKYDSKKRDLWKEQDGDN